MIVSPGSKGTDLPSSLKVGIVRFSFSWLRTTLASGYSVVALAADHVQRTERRHDVAQHSALDELREGSGDLEAGRPDPDAVGRPAAVADEVVPEFAVAGLGVRIDFSLGNLRAFHDELEV